MSSALWRSNRLAGLANPRFTHSFPRHWAPGSRGHMSREVKFVVSSGEDEEVIRTASAELLFPTGRWTLSSDGNGLETVIRFKTFNAAFDFMTRIAAECKLSRHHPEWSNVYNTVFLRWTTHHPPGLSSKDIQLARKCDELAARYEMYDVDRDSNTKAMRLADTVAKAADGCCKPRTGQ